MDLLSQSKTTDVCQFEIRIKQMQKIIQFDVISKTKLEVLVLKLKGNKQQYQKHKYSSPLSDQIIVKFKS